MRRAHALLAVALLLAASALLASDGSSGSRLFWIGAAAVLAASVAGGAVLLGRLAVPASPPALLFLGLLGALVVWQAASLAWSIQPGRSWDYANRGLVYLAFAVLGVLLGAVPPRRVAEGLAALLGALFVVALAAKVIPGLHGDYGRLTRLRWPLGYWNQLALLADLAVPLGLWLAPRRRAEGALLVFGALVVAVLTFSRVGVVLALVGAVLWLWLGRERLASLTAFALAAAGAGVVGGLGLLLPGIADDGQSHGVRLRDGLVFGAVLVVVAVAVALAARSLLARKVDRDRARRLARGGAMIVAAVVLAALVVAVVRAGGPVDFVADRWHEFSNPVSSQVGNDVGRLGSTSSSNRWRWWQEAWDAFADHPVQGTGAGTFALTDLTHRDSPLATVEPHNTPLQFLSETGLVGFLLYAGAVGAVVWGFRRRARGDGGAAVALGIVVLLGLLHAVVDIDWDYLATQGPLLGIAGFLAARPGRVVIVARRPLLAVATGIACLAALYSLLSPWLSDRYVQSGYDALVNGDFAGAASDAKLAHSLDPLSTAPLSLWALAETDDARALDHLRKARDLEPQNPDAWYELGFFEGESLHRWRDSYRDLNHAYTLDNYSVDGRELDKARCKIDPATCQG